MTRLLVDIECLFDTRIGVVCDNKPESLNSINYKEYSKRPKDSSEYIHLDNFEEAFANRKKSCLLSAPQTKLLYGLAETVLAIESKKSDDPTIGDTEILVNFTPFEFDEEEKRIITEGIASVLPSFCVVKPVSVPLIAVTPSYLRDNVDCWYVYEFNKWLGLQFENLKKVQIPTVSIMTPALFAGDVGDSEMFADTEISMSQHFMLHYQPVEHYSVYVV